MKSSDKITNEVLLYMVKIILLEMRVNSNPNYAKIMADILHHLPDGMIRGSSANQIFEGMKEIAERHKMVPLVEKIRGESQKIMQSR